MQKRILKNFKYYRLITTVFIILCVAFISVAHDFLVISNGTSYWYNNIYNGEVQITFQGGTYESTNRTQYMGDIEIPTIVTYRTNKYTVTSINHHTFWNRGTTSVSIPQSVKTIGNYAFGCSALSYIKINNDDPYKISLGNDAFYGVDFNNCKLIVPNGCKEVYASAPGWQQFKKIEEIPILASDIIINPQKLTLTVSQNKKLETTVLPENTTDKRIVWKCDNEDVATVDNDGIVNAVSAGNTTITATCGSVARSCIVYVIQPVESIILSPKEFSLKVGESQTISATVYPANADDKTVSWSSSNEEVATVTNDGKVTAIGPGNAKLYVKSNYDNNIKDSCDITVLQPVTGVNLDSKEIELIVDESIKLNAHVLPNNASNKAVNWTSSDISVAMVSPDGTVYGIKPGQATIMATTVDGGFVALCKVTVKSKIITISSISLSEDSATLAIGEALQLNAIISPTNATTQIIKWSSINPNIASVDANGLVKAITEGTTQVIATTTDGSNLSALCEITVKKLFVSISSIQIVPNSFEMTVGQNGLLEVEITPTDATNKSVTWSSTNPSVVTVTQDGAVQAHSEGKVVIIASTKDGSNLSAICSVSVKSESGVETITIDNDTQVKIYSLSGVLLYEGLFLNCRLKPDFYIIIHNGCSYKIKITQ